MLGIVLLLLPWAAMGYLLWTRRQAGPAVLSLGNPYRIPYYVAAAFFVLAAVATLPVVRALGSVWYFYTVFFLTFAIFFFVDGTSSRALAEKGVLLPRQLIRWERIASYEWVGHSTLVLALRSRRSATSHQRLRIKPPLRERVEEILRQRVSPSHTQAM